MSDSRPASSASGPVIGRAGSLAGRGQAQRQLMPGTAIDDGGASAVAVRNGGVSTALPLPRGNPQPYLGKDPSHALYAPVIGVDLYDGDHHVPEGLTYGPAIYRQLTGNRPAIDVPGPSPY